ncbi:hypothetical protein L226DRAFT_197045 [Lentinus tigrinus ALCF2SS1-7]|nr:hypothetical protein L226DRAFT_197045 [Lentinus tigrinus ALCF2SS1-7]
MPASDVPADIGLLAGPQLFGHLFNYGLFGILTVQVYVYHLLFPRDPIRLKVLIYSLYTIECLQVAMASHDANKVLGVGWGNVEELYKAHWLWITAPVMTGIVSTTVQFYFSWRIYVLSGSALLSVFICLIALMQGCAALASGITAHLLNNSADLQDKTMPTHIVWMVGSTTCDIVITACMVYYLSRGRQGMATDALLSRLMRSTVETGALTASVALLDLVLFTTCRHNNLHMTPALVLTKVYTNTLMMLVNNRARMRQLMMQQQDDASDSGSLQWAVDRTSNINGTSPLPRPRTASPAIGVALEVHHTGASDSEEHALDLIGKSKAP